MAAGFLKGALVSFTPTFIGVAPNVTVFQINPETITHDWKVPEAAPPPPTPRGWKGPPPPADPLAVRGLPGETFSFTLFMDANDQIADAGINLAAAEIATNFGLYTRLSALEMLLYPLQSVSAGLVGTVSASVSSSGLTIKVTGAAPSNSSVPRLEVPVVLFVWGLQRIVPVRVTQLNITEKLYDAGLHPIHAEAQMTLRVLTPEELVVIAGPMKTVANIAYVYTQGLRQAQALLNLADAGASILGMLPTPF
jgi:hypothetical protein